MDGGTARRAARQFEQGAEQVRSLTAGLLAVGVGTPVWRSGAADLFRGRLGEEAHRLARTALLLDEAARAWHAHADAVDDSRLWLPPLPGSAVGGWGR